ncbi:MAG: LysE family translocator [Elainella sp.]
MLHLAPNFGLFLTAAFLLSITPGPGLLYVLARSLHGGRREGLLSCLGTFMGGLFHVVAAGLGLSAVLMTSALAFSLIKYAGAAYLIYMGIRMLVERNGDALEAADLAGQRRAGRSNALRQGIITEILNPKTALFFLAFIPQFVDPTAGTTGQFLLLGLITALFNLTSDTIVAWFAGPIGQYLKRHRQFRKRQQQVSGLILIGLGTSVAVAEQN